jgi:beta-glucanase (GH16 family)
MMRRLELGAPLTVVSILLLLALPVVLAPQTSRADTEAAQWILTWNDEFNGPRASGVDTTKWVFDIGGWNWGNHELQYYTNRAQNVSILDGNLAITAQQEKYTGPDKVSWNYTSARLKTLGRFTQTYGRFEARIKIPFGQGIWPAFWMLGEDIEKVGWPNCGEIDIMENIGREPSTVHGTLHGPGESGTVGIEARYSLTGQQRFADHFHVYAVEWEPQTVRFYMDNDLYATHTGADLPPGTKWVFDHPFFMLLNVAVGGAFPGNPDASSVFPQIMLVDYVRVFRRPRQ